MNKSITVTPKNLHKKDYRKDGHCTAKQYSQCKNFQPVHDLDFCRYCGIGWTCNFEVEE